VVSQADLLEVVDALRTRRRVADFLNGRNKQRDQNGDDRDDHQQFNQGKARSPAFTVR